MITADQLVAHAIGDYVLQSDWMATEKVKRSVACVAHVATYVLPFLFLTRSPAAIAVIVGTHFVIDRWRLARFVCWAKNWLAPPKLEEAGPVLYGDARINARMGPTNRRLYPTRRNPPWRECRATGYPPDRPEWMTVWLLIIADNVMHVLCNAAAIHWL